MRRGRCAARPPIGRTHRPIEARQIARQMIAHAVGHDAPEQPAPRPAVGFADVVRAWVVIVEHARARRASSRDYTRRETQATEARRITPGELTREPHALAFQRREHAEARCRATAAAHHTEPLHGWAILDGHQFHGRPLLVHRSPSLSRPRVPAGVILTLLTATTSSTATFAPQRSPDTRQRIIAVPAAACRETSQTA